MLHCATTQAMPQGRYPPVRENWPTPEVSKARYTYRIMRSLGTQQNRTMNSTKIWESNHSHAHTNTKHTHIHIHRKRIATDWNSCSHSNAHFTVFTNSVVRLGVAPGSSP
jgi:hypothetical protein